ncbi:MAG: sigma-70 family RNA polymerase sigma factor [Synechococcales bacterium]|nr:sigma-70 family RNA polymerase sigma factor [Synechococcales bacterium]
MSQQVQTSGTSQLSPEVAQQWSEDRLLVERLVQQDQSALSALYDRYARVVYSIAYRSLGSVEESEEVVLDVFSQVWKTAERYDASKARVDSWIFMMARSRILDRLRKVQRVGKIEAASVEIAVQEPKTESDPVESLAVRERRKQVFAALAQLPPEQRRVIELAYYQGLSHSEIANLTQLSLGTVKTRIRLGLSKLRNLLVELT